MSNLALIMTGLGAVTAGILIGRYSAPEKIKVETVTVEKVVEHREEETREDKVRVITKIVRPSGETITRTRVEARREASIASSKDSQTMNHTVKEIENRRGVRITAFAGLPLTDLAKGIAWGAAVSKTFIGPVSLGVFGFSDLKFGLSVGIEL